MMKYKVGDKVRIRKDLDVGMFYGGCRFVLEMRDLVGETVRITEVSKRDGYYRVDSNDKYWTDEMFEGKEKMNDNDSIRILVSGNQVVAIHMETGKKGVARCHPDDVFDPEKGMDLARSRALLKRERAYYKATSALLRDVLKEADAYADVISRRQMKEKTLNQVIERCTKTKTK
jgi:hypothetical protein